MGCVALRPTRALALPGRYEPCVRKLRNLQERDGDGGGVALIQRGELGPTRESTKDSRRQEEE